MRSARSYPEPAVALFKRASANERMRDKTFADLMGFTPIMMDVSPEAVFEVTRAALVEELPQDRIDREKRKREKYFDTLKRVRAIPESERTEAQHRVLQHVHLPAFGDDRIDREGIGIEQHNSYYFPPSALHEPFASLFSKHPDFALHLVRELANHATKGWSQIEKLARQRTPTR
jgi:hypothetical protein